MTALRSVSFFFAVSAAALLALASCRSETSSPSPSKDGKARGRGPVSLEAVVARPLALEAVVRVPGNLSGARRIELKTEVGGRIAQLGFKEGASVAQGTVLLRLADEDLAATVAKNEAKAKLARLVVDRKRQQLAVDGASRQEFDAAEADLASAEADLALARAQLRKTRVVAPFAGVAGIRSVELGQTVAAGQSVATLSQRAPWRIEFAIPEEQATSAKVGQDLSFTAGGSPETYPARIVALDPVLDEATRTRRAVAECRSTSPSLFPGTVVDIALPLHRADGIAVPAEALGFDAKGPMVWVYRGGRSVQTRIAIGLRTADRVEARSGVKPGDTVLVVGAATLKPDGEVKIARVRDTP